MNKGITSWTEIEGGKESGHTPLPWEADIHMGNDGYEIADMIEPSICEMVSSHSPEETKANAQFIVKACNCHDELVEALKAILTLEGEAVDANRYGTGDHERAVFNQARAILAKAKTL